MRDVTAEDIVQLEAAGVVGRDDRRARSQRFDGDGRQRLEDRGQDEEIGGGAVAGHDAIVHEACECHVTLDAG